MLTQRAQDMVSALSRREVEERRAKVRSLVKQIKNRYSPEDGRRISDAEIAGALGLYVRKRANTVSSWKMGSITRASDDNIAVLEALAEGRLVMVDTGQPLEVPGVANPRRRQYNVDIPEGLR